MVQLQLNNSEHEPGSKRMRALIKLYCVKCHELFAASNDCSSCSVWPAHRCEGVTKDTFAAHEVQFVPAPGVQPESEQARIAEV